MSTDHFDGVQGDHLRSTRLWRSPVCGSLWLDDAPESEGIAECGCNVCGGAEMEVVGWVDAEAIVALALRGKERDDG